MMRALYRLVPRVLRVGQDAMPACDINGNLQVAPAVAVDDVAGVIKVEHRYTFTNITTNTTTVVKATPGFLHAIVLNTPVATGTIVLWDNTSAAGAKIGSILIPAAGAGDMPCTIIYDVSFTIGLTIVTATAANDLTVVWR